MEHRTARRWWHGAVLYQLYVRSWQDSDGDGYGDLGGIIAKLDYLSWLGVDGIWLSPTMPSPDDDWGYDVSDYLGVHPELGTLAELDRLIAEAGQRGLRVLLDLVPNHTSSAHPWFVEAHGGPGSEHRDYYVWADPAADGGPPNNWLDATGHQAWTLDDRSGQYYLHNFLPSQPDLNWWEPAVHEEFREILRFWFDRGVAGFRVDVAHGLYKDAELRDNPPLPVSNPLTGRLGLRPEYNANRPESHGIYRDWRKIADSYPAPRLLLGETWVGEFSRLAQYYGHDDELQLAFNFPLVFARFTAAELAGIVADTLAALPGAACPVWTGSNHDVGRFPTRWGGGDERKARLALLILATLPGTTVLYYGDEIGMTDVDIPPQLRRDKMTRDAAAGRENRDRARTPMRWDGSPSGGFTADGVRPWLPLGGAAAASVASQRADRGSVLWLCRDLLSLRRAESGGQIASYQAVPAPDGQWVYRVGGLLVAANLTDQPAACAEPLGEVLLSSAGTGAAAGTAAGTGAGTGTGAAVGAARGAGTGSAAAAGPGRALGPWEGIVARQPGGTGGR
jgi:alpha-glucosidase